MAVYICALPPISWGYLDVRREFMQRLSVGFHGNLGSYIRDALLTGGWRSCCCLPPCSEGVGLCAGFLFFFAGGFPAFFVNNFKFIMFSRLIYILVPTFVDECNHRKLARLMSISTLP
jgi:hypothetical protein